MCERTFTQNCTLRRHVRNQHASEWTCTTCDATFNRQDNFTYQFHLSCDFRATGKRPAENQIGGGEPKRQRTKDVRWRAQALDHATDEYTVDLKELEQTQETILDVLKDAILDLKETVEQELERKRALKIVVALRVTFHQSTDPTFLTEPPAVFSSDPVEVFAATNIDEALNGIHEQLMKKLEEFEERGSGWVLHELLRLDFHAYVHEPLRASTYIASSDELTAKHAVVNIQNKVSIIISNVFYSGSQRVS